MAIDFGRMARGIATGYLGQKLANTAANDELKSKIIERAGINFYENTLPEFQKKEKSREETYKKLSARYGANIAEYMDQEGFITGNPNDYANIEKDLGANDNFNETKLKSYLEATNAGSYESRKESRVSAIQDREKFVTGNLSKNQIGDMTAKLFLSQGETMTDASEATAPKTMTETVTTPAVPGSQVGPVVTKAVPEKTETKEVPLPSYEDIFGDGTEKKETVFFSMDREDQTAYQKLSDAQFKADTLNEVSGMRSIQEAYKTDYNNLDDKEKGKLTLNQYSRERYFREVFLPSKGLSFRTEPADIIKARELINYYNSQGEDTMVEEIRNRLRNKGYNLTDYLL
tara:strand:- start:1114 stop:2148 length:1035 start_codon:yes stop_codon:yes gene_type:complete